MSVERNSKSMQSWGDGAGCRVEGSGALGVDEICVPAKVSKQVCNCYACCPADSADPGFKRLEGLEFRVVSA